MYAVENTWGWWHVTPFCNTAQCQVAWGCHWHPHTTMLRLVIIFVHVVCFRGVTLRGPDELKGNRFFSKWVCIADCHDCLCRRRNSATHKHYVSCWPLPMLKQAFQSIPNIPLNLVKALYTIVMNLGLHLMVVQDNFRTTIRWGHCARQHTDHQKNVRIMLIPRCCTITQNHVSWWCTWSPDCNLLGGIFTCRNSHNTSSQMQDQNSDHIHQRYAAIDYISARPLMIWNLQSLKRNRCSAKAPYCQ